MSQTAFTIASAPASVLSSVRAAARRELPHRYQAQLWDTHFKQRLDGLARPGMSILDVGAGRRPTMAPEERPPDCRYIGLDESATELASAPPGSYDDSTVSPAELHVPRFDQQFDLVVSFFAFEHVRSTASVLDTLRRYLRPGGHLVAQLAGSRSLFSRVNRAVPMSVSRAVLRRTQDRDPATVFPAQYDQCSYSELTAILAREWQTFEVVPLFSGAPYVLFSRALTAGYIAYEEWAYRTGRKNLAAYYLIVAGR